MFPFELTAHKQCFNLQVSVKNSSHPSQNIVRKLKFLQSFEYIKYKLNFLVTCMRDSYFLFID